MEGKSLVDQARDIYMASREARARAADMHEKVWRVCQITKNALGLAIIDCSRARRAYEQAVKESE